MDDRSRIAISTLIGAVAGGFAGYFYLTDSGRRLRGQIEPAIDDFLSEVRRWRGTVEKARAAADESWRSLSDLLAERPIELEGPGAGRVRSH